MPAERSERIEQLYHAARERDPDQRAAFLQQACAGDEALLREVESLLGEDDGVESFLETPALEFVRKMSGEDAGQSMIGRQLGSYHVLSLLGEGGMGEVYCARDTKLDREVALKVLPASFARDPERLARFRREARLLAALNHPNIAAIYGMEEFDGLHCLAMELVPGETLEGAGPLALEEALTICRQLAEGLEEAHRKNITHRDIKPANIKVTPEGLVKILDFGLAKALAWEQPGVDLSELRSASGVATQEGRILGTPAYMSPEQVRGKTVEKQSDIWAFGCVLYELLTGRHAFQGETFTDTISTVLAQEPDWQALPATTSAKVRELLRRCLKKDARRRLQDVGDARIEIEEELAVAGTTTAASEPTVTAVPLPAAGISIARSRWPRRWVIFAGLGCAVAVVAGLVSWNLKPPSPVPLSISRFTITLPVGQRLAGPDQPAVALSPDGSHLVYVAGAGGVQQLYLRAMDSLEAKLIAGTEGAAAPFFSPDGQWVGFFAGGKLQRVSISGGAVSTISSRPYPGGASWGSQRMIAFPPRINSALHQVPEAGGAAQPLTRLETGERIHTWPEFLPGGKAVLFVAAPDPGDTPTLVVQEIRTGERKNLVRNATQPHYAPPGYLVYAQGGTLLAAPFDPQRLALTGAAVPVEENIMQSPSSGAAQYSFSSTGSLIYVSGGIQGSQLRLVWVSRDGAEQPLTAPAHAYVHPRISPDGRRVAAAIFGEQGTHIWIYDFGLETLTPLTFEGGGNNFPTWTPDGRRIAFRSNRAGAVNMFWQLANGSGGLERLGAGVGNNLQPSSFSPNSQLLAFRDLDAITGSDIWVLRLSDQKVQPFLRTQFNEGGARFSPDGHWLAYSSDESGRAEIYVQPYPGPGGKWQISTEGGGEPTWNLNGRELFYRSGRKMMAVDVMTRPTFSSGKPKMLFEGQYQPTQSNQPNYSVSPDGQRFLMLKPIEQQEQAATQINVVLNWFEELRRKVPLKK
jgi:serine/threonine-protein kinase